MELDIDQPVRIFVVDWQQTAADVGWQISEGSLPGRTLLFPRKYLSLLPQSLRDTRITTQFQALIKNASEFSSWWDQVCGNSGDKVFLLRFPQEAWSVPWELLVERLFEENRPTVCLARSSAVQIEFAPQLYDEPLRVLILQGDSGEGIGQPLDLDAELALIQGAWQSLDLSIRNCIEAPHVRKVALKELPQVLSKLKPHIIWFSGHGRAVPTPGLLFEGCKWIEASELASAFQCSDWVPIYAVFWACDTARVFHRGATVEVTPALFDQLRAVGIVSILAMQSPVRDSSARAMAKDLFAHLASGFPLEQAVGRARANLLAAPPQEAYRYDWASPVVWSAARLVKRLNWNSSQQLMAQVQLFGRQAMRRRLENPSILDGDITDQESLRARLWGHASRTWVYSPTGYINDAAHQLFWFRTLQAVQTETMLLVLTIPFLKKDDLEEQIQEWAEATYGRLLPGDAPTPIAKAINKTRTNAISGWKSICSLPNICLAISWGLEWKQAEWFWEPLLANDTGVRTIILSGLEPEMTFLEGWELDRVDAPWDDEHLEAAIQEAPRLAGALATLDMPIRSSYLLITTSEGVGNLGHWQQSERLLVDTVAGPIMLTQVRRRILERLSPEEKLQAHRDCIEILGNPELQLNVKIREQRLKHLIEANLRDAALDEAEVLCDIYRREERPLAVLSLLKQLREWQLTLSQEAHLTAAWAYLQKGKLKETNFWLRRTNPTKTLVKAEKHGLQAELYKSQGLPNSKIKALNEINAAIECLEALADSGQAETARRKLRAYQQDRARIRQYLFYEAQAAADEYKSLVQQWSDESDANLDLAIVKRNWAASLLTLSTSPNDPNSTKAKDLLREAEALAKPYSESFARSEILYELSKAQEATNVQKAKEALESCIHAAKQSFHFMMLAIAENRRFWRYERFSLLQWEKIEEELDVFSRHGWAIRSAIDGRLRVSRYLFTLGDINTCKAKLDKNWLDLVKNPSFDQGSDQYRIAQTAAGLELLNGNPVSAAQFWDRLVNSYPALMGLRETLGTPSSAELWDWIKLPEAG